MCIQTSARLFLLLVAAIAICSYGNATEAPICTRNSDCDFSQGVCEKGKCRCNDGYQRDYDGSYAFCRKVKKIGEWCIGFADKCEPGSECSKHHKVCVRENTQSTARISAIDPSAAAPGEPCTSNSDCNYDGGVCLKSDQCQLGFCFCDVGLQVSLRRRACAKPKIVGEPCVPHDQCIGWNSYCKNNVCSCEVHGSTPSDDKTQCYRKHGDTCNSRSDCLGMQCMNGTCGCGDDKIYITSPVVVAGASSGNCMHKNITPKKKNEMCDPGIDDDPCKLNNLTCNFCPESAGIYKCLSYHYNTATTPCADQVSMIASAVGSLFVFATLVVTLY